MQIAATTALALILGAGSAVAQSQGDGQSQGSDGMTVESGMTLAGTDLIRTRDITGGDIYALDVDDEEWLDVDYDTIDADWEDIGEIEDVLLGPNGQLQGIVAEIGGFLDIADKHVFLMVDDVKLVPVDGYTYAYVTRFSEDQLEDMQDIDEGWWN